MARKEREEDPHQPFKLETVWKACQKFKDKIKRKVDSFQIDNTTLVAYLMKKCGTYYKEMNIFARKILLRCHNDKATVCLKYIQGGVANLRADKLSRDMKA